MAMYILKRNRKGNAFLRLHHVKMEMGHHTVAHISAGGDNLTLTYLLALRDVTAAFANMGITGARSVFMPNYHQIIRPVYRSRHVPAPHGRLRHPERRKYPYPPAYRNHGQSGYRRDDLPIPRTP